MIAGELPHEILAYVIAPLIALAGVLVPLIVKLNRVQASNSDDHGRVRDALDALTEAQRATHGEVSAIGSRLDDHIHDHRNQRGAA